MKIVQQVLLFSAIWFGLTMGIGLIMGIYGAIKVIEISDMTYGYAFWAALFVTIVITVVMKVLRKKNKK